MPSETAEILRIHISESDRHSGRPLYEALIAKCRELGIAGATVFQGVEGYGETAEMHKAHLAHSNRPIVIVVVDTAGNIERLIAAAAGMMDTGLMAKSAVQMIRVHKSGE
jgi:PII-like signaling protein